MFAHEKEKIFLRSLFFFQTAVVVQINIFISRDQFEVLTLTLTLRLVERLARTPFLWFCCLSVYIFIVVLPVLPLFLSYNLSGSRQCLFFPIFSKFNFLFFVLFFNVLAFLEFFFIWLFSHLAHVFFFPFFDNFNNQDVFFSLRTHLPFHVG